MTSEMDDSLNSIERHEIDLDLNDGVLPSSPARMEATGTALSRNTQKLGSDGLTYPIGFLHVTFNSSNGNAVGGMLVTDNTGIPLEFLITTAVRPTRAQQILYGKRLNSFIAINLCGVQLLNDIKTKPKVVFVQDEYMLDLVGHTSIPVLVLRQTEQLGAVAPRPTVVPPRERPEYADVVDLTSLDADMIDAFDRIEKCREVLASRNEEYKL